MTTHVDKRADGVAVLTMDNPPVNSLAGTLIASFMENLAALQQDASVKAIVVTGKGGFFCGGAAIDEFGKMPKGSADPLQPMHDVINALDASSKVTVAAINGMALGGGCEVAMGCHYRVMSDKAKLGLPEISLGLLPGGQGTQRLPRLVPIEVASGVIMAGQQLDAKKAPRAGLVDAVAPAAKVVEQACAFALKVQGKPRPVSKMPVPTAEKVKAFAGGLESIYVQANKAMPKGSIAHTAIYECLKAAYLQPDFQKGLQVEKEQFIGLVLSTESAAMRHLFFAQRAAPKVKGIDAKLAKPIKKVGILGAGLMGGGIAMCFMKKGVPVVLKDAKQEWLDAGVDAIKKNYQIQVKKRKLTEDKYAALMALLTPTLNYDDFRGVDLIIEAVPEIMDLKKQVFQDLGKVVGPDTLVCTNTSGLDIDEIATAIPNPSRVMGTHFFSPANVMQLLENVRTKEASDQTIATCMAMGKLIGKQTVLVGNCDGFVGNRMVAPYSSEARMMVEEGCDPEFMDDVVQNQFGMAMGPNSLGDLVGTQLFYNQRKAKGDMKADTKTNMGPHDLTDLLVESGRFGQKNGKGMYNYDMKTRKKLGVDAGVKEGVKKIQQRKKTQVRGDISAEEVIERLFFSMANEGFKILDEGFAQRPSDVDIVYIYGYGFPPVKGGPLFWVDNYIGLDVFLAKLRKYDAAMKQRAESNPEYRYYDYFKPSPMLEKCVAEGKTLAQFWKAREQAAAKM